MMKPFEGRITRLQMPDEMQDCSTSSRINNAGDDSDSTFIIRSSNPPNWIDLSVSTSSYDTDFSYFFFFLKFHINHKILLPIPLTTISNLSYQKI